MGAERRRGVAERDQRQERRGQRQRDHLGRDPAAPHQQRGRRHREEADAPHQAEPGQLAPRLDRGQRRGGRELAVAARQHAEGVAVGGVERAGVEQVRADDRQRREPAQPQPRPSQRGAVRERDHGELRDADLERGGLDQAGDRGGGDPGGQRAARRRGQIGEERQPRDGERQERQRIGLDRRRRDDRALHRQRGEQAGVGRGVAEAPGQRANTSAHASATHASETSCAGRTTSPVTVASAATIAGYSCSSVST
ncbi:MAG: hypothetical protein IPP06_18950 [Saprospiraceae bacterium]|nr:hypothetical protein [Candidatus Vicinibacter affinis]